MTDTVEATIVDLDALLADDEHDTCMIGSVTHWITLLRRWRFAWPAGGECYRPAVAVVTIACPEHGENVRAVCRKHLALLRRERTTARCPYCDRRTVIRDLAS